MLTQQLSIVAVSTFLSVVTFWAVSVRLLQRKVLSGRHTSHDWLISVAAVFALLMAISLIIATSYGLGSSDALIDTKSGISMKKAILATNLFYFAVNMFVKLSLLEFYKDLTLNRAAKHFIIFMAVTSVAFGLSCLAVVLAQCTPFTKIWDTSVPGTCSRVDVVAFMLFAGYFMIFIDIVLYAMPVVFTWNLRMTWGNKIGLYFVFGLGILVLTSSAIRLYIVYQFKMEGDFAYHYGTVMLCSIIENHIAVWVACAPYIKSITKPVLARFSTAYSSFKTRMATRSRGGSSPSDDEDPDMITSMGGPSGPPMIPPVRRSSKFGKFGNVFRHYGYLSNFTTKLGPCNEGTPQFGGVEAEMVDQSNLHPALRTPTPNSRTPTPAPAEFLCKEGNRHGQMVIVQVDSVGSSMSSQCSTPVRDTHGNGFLGPSPV